MDRRSSHDDATPPKPPEHTNPNVFDDEYAVDPEETDFIGVADGFRPGGFAPGSHVRRASGDEVGDQQTHQERPLPSFSAQSHTETSLRRLASRNSTAKPPPTRESTVKDPLHAANHSRGHGSQTAALQHRISIASTNSFATMARSESPFETGPSHPYAMYTQTTAARTPSVTTANTTSTGRQPRRSLSIQQPTHPYALYPQNVAETPDESPVAPTPAPIPVGFHGIAGTYHRRIGPDGEEQDIIGPDGHTEQLPPYSRYPDEGPTKAALLAEASARPEPPPDRLDTPVVPAPAEAPRRPPVQTVEATREPSSPGELSVAERGVSEKQEANTKRSRLWGEKRLFWNKIPLGMVVLLLVLVLVFAIVLGAAIGTVVARGKKWEGRHGSPKKSPHETDPEPQVTETQTNSMFDATPLATPPASLPDLPYGSYALPLGIPQESSPNCLTTHNQLSAWSCKTSLTPLVLTVNLTTPNGGRTQIPLASIEPIVKPDGGYQYGVQPPTLRANLLQLVIDQDFRAYGPAWHFQRTYDKIVVLDQEEFVAGASLLRRKPQGSPNLPGFGNGGKTGDSPTKPSTFRHRFQVQPGDTPWFCIWNQTFIEGYIYVTDNSTAASFTGFPSYPTAYPTNTPGAWPPWFPAQTTSGNGSPPGPSATPTSSPVTSGGAGVTPRKAEPQPTLAIRGDADPRLPAYPRIVKIEERRLPGSPTPYCKRMQLNPEGKLVDVLNGTGQPIMLPLQEESPSLEEFRNPGPSSVSSAPTSAALKSKRGSKVLEDLGKRRDPADACHCQWMFQ